MKNHQRLSLSLLWVVLLCLGAGCATTPYSSFAVHGGEDDYDNNYRSTVLVKTDVGFCSGVLIAPSTVLSSAHCFCLPRDFKTRTGTEIYTTSACKKEATITHYLYQSEGGKWVDIPQDYKGTVVAHEAFKAEVHDGRVKSHVADLAVIHLDKAMTDVIPESLPEIEVKTDERFTVVGFGPSGVNSMDEGVRRFGRNRVTEVITTRDVKEFRFRTGGVHILPGDSGGPCFRETPAGRWLVGINGGFVKEGITSWFTSTFYYREWIERQKRGLSTD